MRSKPRSLSLATLVALPLLGACSGSPPPPPRAVPAIAAADTDAGAVEALDLSPVPAPEGALLQVRSAAPRALARSLDQQLGLGELLTEGIESALPSLFEDDEAVARSMDLDAPFDAVLLHHRNGPRPFFSAATSSPFDRVRARLSDGHSLRALGDAARRQFLIARDGATDPLPVLLCPAAGRDGAGRLVVGEARVGVAEDLARVAPYLSRTLPARAFRRDEGDVQVELLVDSLRAAVRPEIERFTEEFVRDAGRENDPNAPAYTESVVGWATEITRSLRLTVDELQTARATLRVSDQGLSLAGEATVRNPTASHVRHFLEATRDRHPPMDALAQMPPGGFAYAAASASLTPYRATLNFMATVAARVIVGTHRIADADSNALRTALSSLVAQENASGATSAGRDERTGYWTVSLVQTSTPPMQLIANVRAMVTAVRRPGVQRAILAEHGVNTTAWTVVASRALPAGSLLVRIPPPPARPTRPLTLVPTARTPAAPPPPTMELFLVPDGQTWWCVFASNARERLAAARAQHPAPIATEAAAPEGTVGVAALFPSLVAEALRGDPRLAQMVAQGIARGGDGARAPTIVRVAQSTEGEIARLRGSLEAPRSALSLVGQLLRQQTRRGP